MSRKGFIVPPILIAILALVIAVGGVGLAAWRTKYLDKWLPPNIKEMFGRGEKPEEKPVDWKTYRNEEFGFSIRYPADWPSPRQITNPTGAQVEWFRDYRFFITVIPSYDSLEPGTDPLSPESIRESQPKADFSETEFIETLIDGYPALHIKNCPSAKPNCSLVLIHREPAVYEIHSAISETQFLQILSTFRFLE